MKRSGSVMVFVIVLLSVLFVLGMVFLTTTQVDKNSSSTMTKRTALNEAADAVLQQIVGILSRDLWGDNNVMLGGGDLASGAGSSADIVNEPWDAAYSNRTGITPSASTTSFGKNDDAWLASTLPETVIPSDPSLQAYYVWPHISNILPSATDPQGYFGRGQSAFTDTNVAAETLYNRGDGADADGDGILDARWLLSPDGRFRYAVRIIDLCSMVNLNTALESTVYGRGVSPMEIDVLRVNAESNSNTNNAQNFINCQQTGAGIWAGWGRGGFKLKPFDGDPWFLYNIPGNYQPVNCWSHLDDPRIVDWWARIAAPNAIPYSAAATYQDRDIVRGGIDKSSPDGPNYWVYSASWGFKMIDAPYPFRAFETLCLLGYGFRIGATKARVMPMWQNTFPTATLDWYVGGTNQNEILAASLEDLSDSAPVTCTVVYVKNGYGDGSQLNPDGSLKYNGADDMRNKLFDLDVYPNPPALVRVRVQGAYPDPNNPDNQLTIDKTYSLPYGTGATNTKKLVRIKAFSAALGERVAVGQPLVQYYPRSTPPNVAANPVNLDGNLDSMHVYLTTESWTRNLRPNTLPTNGYPDWVNGKIYSTNADPTKRDRVFNRADGRFYVCKTTHTSGATFNSAYWYADTDLTNGSRGPIPTPPGYTSSSTAAQRAAYWVSILNDYYQNCDPKDVNGNPTDPRGLEKIFINYPDPHNKYYTRALVAAIALSGAMDSSTQDLATDPSGQSLTRKQVAQLIVNLADWRDADNRVSKAGPISGTTDPNLVDVVWTDLGDIYGNERQVYVSELAAAIYPNGQSDKNCYALELFNPYASEIDISGWQIRCAAGTITLGLNADGSMSSVRVPGGGRVVIRNTDRAERGTPALESNVPSSNPPIVATPPGPAAGTVHWPGNWVYTWPPDLYPASPTTLRWAREAVGVSSQTLVLTDTYEKQADGSVIPRKLGFGSNTTGVSNLAAIDLLRPCYAGSADTLILDRADPSNINAEFATAPGHFDATDGTWLGWLTEPRLPDPITDPMVPGKNIHVFCAARGDTQWMQGLDAWYKAEDPWWTWGGWKATTRYYRGQGIKNGSNYYICNLTHTSGSNVNTDLSVAGRWLQHGVPPARLLFWGEHGFSTQRDTFLKPSFGSPNDNLNGMMPSGSNNGSILPNKYYTPGSSPAVAIQSVAIPIFDAPPCPTYMSFNTQPSQLEWPVCLGSGSSLTYAPNNKLGANPYRAGERYVDPADGSIWVCLADHNPRGAGFSFADDRDRNRPAGEEGKPAGPTVAGLPTWPRWAKWDPLVACPVPVQYRAGDTVRNPADGRLYECQTTHTAAANSTFADDVAANPTLWREKRADFDTLGQLHFLMTFGPGKDGAAPSDLRSDRLASLDKAKNTPWKPNQTYDNTTSKPTTAAAVKDNDGNVWVCNVGHKSNAQAGVGEIAEDMAPTTDWAAWVKQTYYANQGVKDAVYSATQNPNPPTYWVCTAAGNGQSRAAYATFAAERTANPAWWAPWNATDFPIWIAGGMNEMFLDFSRVNRGDYRILRNLTRLSRRHDGDAYNGRVVTSDKRPNGPLNLDGNGWQRCYAVNAQGYLVDADGNLIYDDYDAQGTPQGSPVSYGSNRQNLGGLRLPGLININTAPPWVLSMLSLYMYGKQYSGNPRGWTSGCPYLRGTVVYTGGQAYQCIKAHTSSNFNADNGAGCWRQIPTGVGWRSGGTEEHLNKPYYNVTGTQRYFEFNQKLYSYRNGTDHKDARGNPILGFREGVGEVMRVPEMSNTAPILDGMSTFYWSYFPQTPMFPRNVRRDSEFYARSMLTNGTTTYAGRIETGEKITYGARYYNQVVPGDVTERCFIFDRISDLITDRSDSFLAYVLVEEIELKERPGGAYRYCPVNREHDVTGAGATCPVSGCNATLQQTGGEYYFNTDVRVKRRQRVTAIIDRSGCNVPPNDPNYRPPQIIARNVSLW